MTPTALIETVAGVMNIAPERITGNDHGPRTTDARRVIAVAMRQQEYMLSEIGSVLDRHHTTVVHYLRSAKNLAETDAQFRVLYDYGLSLGLDPAYPVCPMCGK